VSTKKYGTEIYTFLLEKLKVAQLANELQHIHRLLISEICMTTVRISPTQNYTT